MKRKTNKKSRTGRGKLKPIIYITTKEKLREENDSIPDEESGIKNELRTIIIRRNGGREGERVGGGRERGRNDGSNNTRVCITCILVRLSRE